MTQTIQSRSCASISEAEKDLTINKDKKEDNMSLLFSVFDSLNELNEVLNRLYHVMERKIVELNIYRKYKGEMKQNEN